MELPEIYAMADAGDEDLLTESERAQLPPSPPEQKSSFNENLAERLDSQTLGRLSQDVHDGYDSDDASRSDWRAREKIGIRLLGISENQDGEPAFEGASSAVFPGLIEAIIQFQARTISELWPAQGPAKAYVQGGLSMNPQREQQAARVADYLNWLFTKKMPGGYKHHDRMLFRLPLSGSCFKKLHYCADSETVVSKFVPAEEVLVPYGSTDLKTAPRITHVISYSGQDIKRLIRAGVYVDRSIDALSEDDEKTDLQPELDAVTSTKPSMTALDKSQRYVLLEQSIFTDIPGEPEGAPFLVTIDRESQQVFSVYRDWRESDKKRHRRRRWVHYDFLPGLDGFYGLGLLHALGRTAESMSGNLRALLDAAMLANLRGGFRSADVVLPKGKRGDGISITPGTWQPVEATTEELQKLFVSIPYAEPSQTLFNLLQWMDGVFRRVAGTTSELVGEATKSVPVGTTLARIEQGMKVQSSIQIRCHQAQAEELAIACELTADYLPDADYCRDVLNIAPEQFAADFDNRVDVQPVSDPNAITGTQKLVIAQALVDRAAAAPDLYNRRAVEKRLLETMRLPNADELLVDQSQAPRMGPVDENMALLMTQPVKSFPDQDHQAHLIVHRQWRESITDEETRQRIEAAAVAHEAEHLAWAYLLQMQAAMGTQLPATPMGAGQPMDPQTENMLAMMAAQAVQLMNQQQDNSLAPDPSAVAAEQKSAIDSARAEAEIRRKDALANAQIQRDDAKAIADMRRGAAEQEAKLVSQFVSNQARRDLGEIPVQ